MRRTRSEGPDILGLASHYPKVPLIQVANRLSDVGQGFVVSENRAKSKRENGRHFETIADHACVFDGCFLV